MLAAFALGACGVQVGTCLLTSKECPIHENYKAAILAARDSSTVITGRSVGAPVRCIKNPMTHAYLKMEQEGVDKARLEELTLGSLRRAVFEGDVKQGAFWRARWRAWQRRSCRCAQFLKHSAMTATRSSRN